MLLSPLSRGWALIKSYSLIKSYMLVKSYTRATCKPDDYDYDEPGMPMMKDNVPLRYRMGIVLNAYE